MVIQGRTIDYLTSDEFKATRDFLSRFGISPRSVDEHFEDDVLNAIRSRGWEPSIDADIDPPGWKVAIREHRTLTQSRTAVAHDRDRMLALLRAIRLALTWPSPEEERQAFEEQTQALLGLTADEFMQQWHNNELSTDDPRVTHLLVMRPLGW